MGTSHHRLTRHARAGLSAFIIALIGSLVALPFAAPAPVRAAGTIYVTPNGTGDGSSWASAANLQDALANATGGDEIWVTEGVYYAAPTFQLVEGVAIYGGFVGGETSRYQRDWQTNVTILSGDIDQNDTNIDDNNIAETWADIQGGNTGPVVNGATNASLDGVTITAGSSNSSGGGMNSGGNPTLTNVTFSGNQATNNGGGIFHNGGSPTLENVIFSNNQADAGGGIFHNGGNPTLENVTFSGNQATNGGGMYNDNGSSPTLENVIFSNNQAAEDGGGMYNDNGSSPTLDTVTFSNNQADAGGGMRNANNSNPLLTNVTFNGNQAGRGGGMNNNTASPTLENVTFSNNQASIFGGGISNAINSDPILENVTFSGNQATENGGGMSNFQSDPILENVTFSGNQATNNGGGMVNSNSNPTLKNVTFSGNQATNNGGGMVNSSNFVRGPTLTNVTFSGNQASNGGGMYNDDSNPTIQNSILWGNTATISGPQVHLVSSTPSYTYSLIEGSGGSGAGWDTSLGTDGGNNIDTDPIFIGPVGASAAPTIDGDYRLQPGSPAIDAGDNDADTDTNTSGVQPLSATDLDGYARFVDDPDTADTGNGTAPVVDLGAYEVGVDLVLTKTAGQTEPSPGDTITYTLTLSNNGEFDTSTAIVSDTLPSGLSFVAGSLEIDGSPADDPTGATLADNLTVLTNTTVTMRFAVRVDADVLAGTIITNTAKATCNEDASLISSSAVVTVPMPSITVSVTPSTSSAEVGEEITYSYHFTNTGNVTLDPVVAIDTFGNVTLSTSSLAPGERATGTQTHLVTEDDLPTLANTVTLTGTTSTGIDVSDTASASVEVTSSPAIAISVAPDVSSAEAGDTITYSYRVTNTGNVLLDPVVAVDTLGTVTLDTSSLAPGAATNGTLTYTVQPSDPLGPLTNTVTVTGTTVLDTEATNTTSTTVQVTDTIAPAPPGAPTTTETNNPYPTVSGTAEPSSTVTVVIDLGGGASVTYTTSADPDGNWSIDLATATPTDGALPEGGLAPGEYPVTVTATDAAGNVSDVMTFTLTITSGNTTLYLPLIAR